MQTESSLPGAGPALTIYNKNFAVVRETIPLDLKAGNNTIRFSGATAHLEPDSVILRDPATRQVIQVIEQNYRNDPVSQESLLGVYEGKTIEFQTNSGEIVQGRIVRSGYVPHYQAMPRYGQKYAMNQAAMVRGGAGKTIIEVGGKVQFTLPGLPLFPGLGEDTMLTPALDWIVYSPQTARFEAELSYISGGISWYAAYNVVAPESGNTLDLVGWVTLDNQSGKQFDNARIKLMAGDVNKTEQPDPRQQFKMLFASAGAIETGPQVTERAFEDYHLYTLPLPTTVHDRETKQVEFIRTSGIESQTQYVYDGGRAMRGHNYADLRQYRTTVRNSIPTSGSCASFQTAPPIIWALHCRRVWFVFIAATRMGSLNSRAKTRSTTRPKTRP